MGYLQEFGKYCQLLVQTIVMLLERTHNYVLVFLLSVFIFSLNPAYAHPIDFAINGQDLNLNTKDQSDQNNLRKNPVENFQDDTFCQKGFQKDIFPDFLRLNLEKMPNRELLVDTAYGFKMYVDSIDGTVSKIIANTGTWEPSLINIIGKLIKKGQNVLNVGSQSGLQALIMGKIIGEAGKLFIFEPYSFSYNLVSKNIEINNLTNISQIYQYGASDQQSTGVIKVNFANTGASQIFPSEQNNNPKSSHVDHLIHYKQQVKLNKIDSLLPKDVKIDFALIDVEGMELKVLRGMKELMDRSPNLVIMSQWQYASQPNPDRSQALDLLTYMIDKGYRIYSYVRRPDEKENCKIGKFRQYKKLQTLLHIRMVDLFFFPKNSSPPTER